MTLTRFRAEARHAGRLSHPGIAQVYDYAEATKRSPAFLVMELVDGPSLAEVLASSGPLDPGRTADVIAQAAAALQAAHTAGVLHRDVKPGNLLLARDGQVKVTDFGIAQSPWSEELTGTGALIGTMGYLAPERVSGAAATPAADLYALGIVGYECLTGQRPFLGEPLQVALAHRDQPLPPVPSGRLAGRRGQRGGRADRRADRQGPGRAATQRRGRGRPGRPRSRATRRETRLWLDDTRSPAVPDDTRGPAVPDDARQPDPDGRRGDPGPDPRRMGNGPQHRDRCPSPARQSRPGPAEPPGPGNRPGPARFGGPRPGSGRAPGRHPLAGQIAAACAAAVLVLAGLLGTVALDSAGRPAAGGRLGPGLGTTPSRSQPVPRQAPAGTCVRQPRAGGPEGRRRAPRVALPAGSGCGCWAGPTGAPPRGTVLLVSPTGKVPPGGVVVLTTATRPSPARPARPGRPRPCPRPARSARAAGAGAGGPPPTPRRDRPVTYRPAGPSTAREHPRGTRA